MCDFSFVESNYLNFAEQKGLQQGLWILLCNLPSSKTAHHRAEKPGVEGHGDEHEEVGEGEGDEVEEGLEGVRPRKQIRPQDSDAASRRRVGRR